MSRRRLLPVVTILASVLPAQALALGCICPAGVKSPKKAARAADAVFLGVADRIVFLQDGRPAAPEVDRLSESVRMVVIFRVVKGWKSVHEARVAVTTGPRSRSNAPPAGRASRRPGPASVPSAPRSSGAAAGRGSTPTGSRTTAT